MFVTGSTIKPKSTDVIVVLVMILKRWVRRKKKEPESEQNEEEKRGMSVVWCGVVYCLKKKE